MAMSPAEPNREPRRVLFVADCGPEVGGGHVMRCLSLARALIARGAACAMLATPAVSAVLDAFGDPGIERLPAGEGPLHELVHSARDHASGWQAAVVVVDHYRLGAEQEQFLQAPVAVIDDLADRPHACRLLIDPSLGRETQDYEKLTPAGARILTGPGYALLAPAFAEARARSLAARRPELRPRRLLVSLGLMDLKGITGRVLQLLEPQLDGLEIDVVVGGQAGSLPWLRHLGARNPRLRLHVDTLEMATLISEADLGVGAGGSSTWERAALGLPCISLILANNQRPLALQLDRRGACLAVEEAGGSLGEALTSAFRRLLEDGELRRRLSDTSAGLCDGEGAGRAAEAVLALAS